MRKEIVIIVDEAVWLNRANIKWPAIIFTINQITKVIQ